MTIEKLTDAIAEALFQEFGSDYEIYTEKVEQGLNGHSFLIRCLNPTKNVFLGQCYKRTNQFSIQYIPSTVEAYAECATVMEGLFECLENVTVDERLIHGIDLNGQITDGVLTVTVNYDGFVLKNEDVTIMTDLTIDSEVKG